MSQVLTVGEALGLLSPHRVGPIMTHSGLEFGVAGAEMNVAIGLSRLGIAVEYWGAVGADPPGRAIRSTLLAEGVGVGQLIDLPHPTGLFMKEWYGLENEPNVYYYRSDSAMRRWRLPEDFIHRVNGIQWLHLSGISWILSESLAENLTRLARHFQQHSRTVSLDFNVRRKLASLEAWSEAMRHALTFATVVMASPDELRWLWGTDDLGVLWQDQVMTGNQVWVVKEGTTRTVAYQHGHQIGEAPTITVPRIVDVVGAGDGFAAGVIAGRLNQMTWDQALDLGNVVGAYAVSHAGDWEGYPDWDMVRAYRQNTHIDR